MVFYCKTKIKYFICFLCLKSVFSSFMLEAIKRYCGRADVDRTCRPWTKVVFRRGKLHCGP